MVTGARMPRRICWSWASFPEDVGKQTVAVPVMPQRQWGLHCSTGREIVFGGVGTTASDKGTNNTPTFTDSTLKLSLESPRFETNLHDPVGMPNTTPQNPDENRKPQTLSPETPRKPGGHGLGATFGFHQERRYCILIYT